MSTLDISKYDFTVAQGRAEFIADTPSGIYPGKNVDGDDIMVFVQRGEGMEIKTRHADKPRFWECVSYDAYGWQESVSYESADTE